ncbi:hypothetical protein F5Y17DRAFT_439966 [Xylariaceae sp. FL0594]|nr:hypothetical protein F5Y17DRAFT_439966 [Xylariaceae sp. FL0594]
MMYNTKLLAVLAALAGASLAQDQPPSSDTGYPSAGAPTDSGNGSNPPQPTDTGSAGPGAGNFECTRSIADLLAGAPTPTGELASAITSYASSYLGSGNDGQVTAATNMPPAAPAATNPLEVVTQVCSFGAQLPESLQQDFSAYATQVVSYVSAQSSAIDGVITSCLATGAYSTDAASYTDAVNSIASHTGPLCAAVTTTPGGGNGTATDTTTVTTPAATTTETGGGVGGGPVTSTGPGGETSAPPTPTGAAAVPTGMLANAAAAAGLLGFVALL